MGGSAWASEGREAEEEGRGGKERPHLHDLSVGPDPRALLVEELGVGKDEVDVVDELLHRGVGAFGYFGLLWGLRVGLVEKEREKKKETNGNGVKGHGVGDDFVVFCPFLLVG